MIKEARGFGDDIAQAQENARINLGVAPDADIQYEIISQSKKKVLGLFGGAKAEVRAFVELPDEPQKKVKMPKKDKKKKKDAAKLATDKKPAEKKKSVEVLSDEPLIDEKDLPENGKAIAAIKYLRSILENIGAKGLSFKAAEKDDNAFIQIDGEDMGVAIGRRGETLDALQYLAGLAANDAGGYFKVSLNIGDYRQKREVALKELAQKVADQVISTGRSRALEPMNPYERRIIHTAIQEIDGVVSNSVGEGVSRRVVVYSENGDMRPPRISGDRRGRDRRNGRRNDRKSNFVNSSPSREPKKDSDIPLYGKIN
ncbi:MAG TPA: hypothetical protein DEW35_00415 [Ruminococcaceae bacterium]|nr:hypothetical protein [Oscillospiraceae bacterium]